ncbi:hypothetical protein [Rahnella contaminans]|uniref:hypothetical protein n=1 Tax=Rahnella contaminans TaxID=2703882 RepID=UPI003C2D89EF
MRKILLLSGAVCLALLTGCTSMPADQIRTELDECSAAKLDNIVYMRADKSVLAVECTPSADSINNPVTVAHPVLYAITPSHTAPKIPVKPAG